MTSRPGLARFGARASSSGRAPSPGRAPTSGRALLSILAIAVGLTGCGDDTEMAFVTLENDFDDPMFPMPPWTICEASYGGTFFDEPLSAGDVGIEQPVEPGLDYVYMVASFGDPTCADPVPLATRMEEETLPGQRRTIAISVPNHQGPCPPMGVPPIPEAQYERVRELFGDYEFPPYADRLSLSLCSM
jgi:hypothetical protein